MRATFAKKEATEKDAAQKLAELLADVSLEFTRKAGENDQLFGSVTSADIAEALAAKGFESTRAKSCWSNRSKRWANSRSRLSFTAKSPPM